MQIQDAVIVTALVLGALMILSACWAWVSQKRFGTPGIVLCGLGTILAGLSIWTHVQFTGPGGMKFEVDKAVRTAQAAQQQAEVATEQAKSAQVAALDVHDSLLASQRQIVTLSKAIRTPPNSAMLQEIQTNAAAEVNKSEALSARLKEEVAKSPATTNSIRFQEMRTPASSGQAVPETHEPQ